jgi:hypothetical protein
MFTCHRFSPLAKLDCPHAVGADAFSTERAESFCHFLLLPPPPVVYHGCKPTNLRVSLGARTAQFQASALWVRSHAGACSLLLSEPERGMLADALKSLKQGVSRRLIVDADHFWQKRYYDSNIRSYAQFVEKLRYIHRNPVKARLCERPEKWEWSSFRHYATGWERRVEIESEWTARKREGASGTLSPVIELPHSSQNRA